MTNVIFDWYAMLKSKFQWPVVKDEDLLSQEKDEFIKNVVILASVVLLVKNYQEIMLK